jgi:hypothetical protein
MEQKVMAKAQKTQDSVDRKPIFVEFPSTSDGKTPKDLPEASQKAMDQVVATIQEVSRQVIEGMEELPAEQRPAEIQLEFGIRFDDDNGAMLSVDRENAAFSARVVWYHKDKPVATLRSVAGLIPPAQDDDD